MGDVHSAELVLEAQIDLVVEALDQIGRNRALDNEVAILVQLAALLGVHPGFVGLRVPGWGATERPAKARRRGSSARGDRSGGLAGAMDPGDSATAARAQPACGVRWRDGQRC
eukprot:COSAG01_NODE_241_length_20597_cov_8.200751_1_plen_113_part_00